MAEIKLTEAKPWLCKLESGHITPCWALDEVLQYPGGRGTRTQGLEKHSLVSMESDEFTRDIITLKSGKHGKVGLTLNFCPYCGNELQGGKRALLDKQDKQK